MFAKDDDEHPIPADLHAAFHKIAEAFASGDYLLRHHPVDGVIPVDPSTAGAIAKNIEAYGDSLAPLNSSTWDHAVYRWMGGYWYLLIDLATEREEVSDLTLHAMVHDIEPPMIAIQSVHVP